MLHFGQSSPLRCILLSPQGLATLWGPLLPRPESQSDGVPERDETTLIRLIFNLVSAGTHIKCAAGYLWSASVRSTDLDFSPQKNLNPYPAQLSVKGVCQGGSSVPLDRVLPTFARTKVGPRRVGVQTRPFQKALRRRQATANYPPPGRRTGYAFAKGPAPPLGDRQLGLKIFYLLFLGEKQPLAGHEWRAKRDFAL